MSVKLLNICMNRNNETQCQMMGMSALPLIEFVRKTQTERFLNDTDKNNDNRHM